MEHQRTSKHLKFVAFLLQMVQDNVNATQWKEHSVHASMFQVAIEGALDLLSLRLLSVVHKLSISLDRVRLIPGSQNHD